MDVAGFLVRLAEHLDGEYPIWTTNAAGVAYQRRTNSELASDCRDYATVAMNLGAETAALQREINLSLQAREEVEQALAEIKWAAAGKRKRDPATT
jgi:hypothetical protein